MNLRTRQFDGWVLCIVLAITAGIGTVAQAQGSVPVSGFTPSETAEGGFAISRPDDLGHLRWSGQVYLDYANSPFKTIVPDPAIGKHAFVSDHLSAHVGVALGLVDRLVLHIGLPVSLAMNGEGPIGDVSDVDDFGVGDLSLTARLRLLGEFEDVFGLAIQLGGTAPTGGGNYRGDESFTVHPELLAELRFAKLRATLNAGAIVRENQDVTANAPFRQVLEIADQFTFGLGLTYALFGTRLANETRLDAHLEGFGATNFNDFFDNEETAFEGLAGLKLHATSGLAAGLAGSAGRNAFASPDFRLILTVGYAKPRSFAPPAPVDADGDGIEDPMDQCVDVAEDMDGFEDTDGCPDADNDADGVSDADDACPDDAEDIDGFEDADGCPDADNDGDGILDASDECPLVVGTRASRGCPDPDRDGDGVVDRLDNCPDVPGTVENQGCEVEQMVIMRDSELEILDKVYFQTGSARILRRSHALLDNVAEVITSHPEIELVRVEGHTDNVGDADYNLRLSQQRADSVVEYLTDQGVEPARLEAVGYGQTHPLEPNESSEGRAMNRRVGFKIPAYEYLEGE